MNFTVRSYVSSLNFMACSRHHTWSLLPLWFLLSALWKLYPLPDCLLDWKVPSSHLHHLKTRKNIEIREVRNILIWKPTDLSRRINIHSKSGISLDLWGENAVTGMYKLSCLISVQTCTAHICAGGTIIPGNNKHISMKNTKFGNFYVKYNLFCFNIFDMLLFFKTTIINWCQLCII